MRKKYHREDILEKGMEIIRMQGYHNTGINDILEICGIPKGSFYNFFTSKEDFGIQVIEFYGKQYQNIARSFFTDEKFSPFQRLKNFYQSIIEINENEDYLNGCLINNLCNETAGIYDSFSKSLDIQLQGMIYEISLCIQEAQKIGEVRDDFSARELAAFIHYNAYGAHAHMKSTRSAEPLELFLD